MWRIRARGCPDRSIEGEHCERRRRQGLLILPITCPMLPVLAARRSEAGNWGN